MSALFFLNTNYTNSRRATAYRLALNSKLIKI